MEWFFSANTNKRHPTFPKGWQGNISSCSIRTQTAEKMETLFEINILLIEYIVLFNFG